MTEFRFSVRQAAELLGISKETVSREWHALKKHTGFLTRDDLAVIRERAGVKLPEFKDRVILFLSLKGGTGKTTLSSAFAHILAQMGYRVLAIDLDSQGHLTNCLGLDGDKFERTLYDVLIEKVPIETVVVPSIFPDLDVIPSNLSLSPMELSLVSLNARELRFQKALESLAGRYDVIVVDSHPNLGLLNLNALLACDDLIIPCVADFLSYHSLKLIFDTLEEVKTDFNFSPANTFIMVNRFSKNLTICQESYAALKKYYAPYLLEPLIRQSTDMAKASSRGLPAAAYSPFSTSSLDIMALVRGYLGRTGEKNGPEQTGPEPTAQGVTP